MSDYTPPKYSAAELADTGRWHLTVRIGRASAEAWLKYIADDSAPTRLFGVSCDPGHLVEQLECALYDNPRVLDDFSADIILDTDMNLWLPGGYAADREGQHAQFGRVWPGMEAECVADTTSAEVCVFALAPGLGGLLRRMFPGARTVSALSVVRASTAPEHTGLTQVTVDLSAAEGVNVAAVGSDGLLFAVTLPLQDPAKLAAWLGESIALCGASSPDVAVTVSAPEDSAEAHRLSERLASLGLETAVRDLSAEAGAPGLPLAVALSATRRRNTAF